MTEQEFIAAIAAMNADEEPRRRKTDWSVTYRVNGELIHTRTITASADTIDIQMLDAAPFAPNWHRGGNQRDTAGNLITVRLFATHRRQGRELIATRT